VANDIKDKVEPVKAEQVSEVIKSVATAKKEPVHKEEVKQLIYVGPNLLGLTKYTVVESLKVPNLQKFIKDCPEIKKLIVPIKEMAEIEARIKQKGTLEHRYFNKVYEFKAGGAS